MIIKIYTGVEHLLIERMVAKDKRMVDMPEYGYRKFDTISSEITEFFSYAGFSNVRLAYVVLDKIDGLDNPVFKNYLMEQSENGDYLVVVVRSCDKRKSIYKDCDKRGLIMVCDKLVDKNLLMQFLLREILSYGGRITPGAMELFLERTRYLDDEGVSLYHLTGLLKDLVDYQSDIDEGAVRKIVPENILNNVFSLSKLLLSGDMESVFKQLPGLQKDSGSIPVLSALLREFRIAKKVKDGFSKSEVGLKYGSVTFSHLSDECIVLCIELITQAISNIKGGVLLEKEALTFTMVELFRIFTENKVYC